VGVAVLLAVAAPAVKPSGTKPAGDPGDWVTPDDYPPEALRAGAAGITAFRLDVDESGQVTQCTVTKPSGTASLDQAACASLKARARFTPAIGKAGKAIASTYSSAVRWSLPISEDTPSVSMASCAPGPLDLIKVITPAGCG
jgi:protein TonB